MFRVIRWMGSRATAGTIFAGALALTGCLDNKLLGGGGETVAEGGATTSPSGGAGGATMGGSGGVPMGGASQGGSGGGIVMGGASQGGSGGGIIMGGASQGGSGGGIIMGGASQGGSGGGIVMGGASQGGSGGAGGGIAGGWARQFGDGNIQDTFGVATDATGNVIVTGTISGTTVMDGFTLSASSDDAFVAKLDPLGNVLWAKDFGNGLGQDGWDVATDPAGNIILTGGFHGTVNFGGGALTSAGDLDLYVVKLDPAGNHLWSKRFGDAAGQPIFPGAKVVTDAAGSILLAGTYRGALDFGGGALSTGGAGQMDVYLAKLDANGNHVYSHRYGDLEAGNQIGEKLRGLAVDSAGNAVLCGNMDGSIDFGGGALPAAIGTFVAKIGPTGSHVWSKVFGATSAELDALTITPQNGVVLQGVFTGQIDFGGGPLNGANGYGVLVKFDSAGALVWAKQLGGNFRAQDAATSAAGATTFAGYTYGNVDLTGIGGGILTSFQGSSNAVIVTLAADGSLLAAKNYSMPSMDIGPDKQLRSVVYDPSGYIVTAGSFDSLIDMGFGVMDGGTFGDILVARLPQSL